MHSGIHVSAVVRQKYGLTKRTRREIDTNYCIWQLIISVVCIPRSQGLYYYDGILFSSIFHVKILIITYCSKSTHLQMYISMQKMYIRNSDMYIILIITISYMPISSKIKLSGATKPRY